MKIGSMTSDYGDAPHRLIINEEGDEKTGKNFFAFSGQWPLAYFNIGERNNDDLLEWWQEKKKKPFVQGKYMVPVEDILRVTDKATIQKNADQARVEYKRWRADFHSVLSDRGIRTIVIDNGKNINTLIQLCKFGKLVGNIDPGLRGQANLDFMNIIYKVRATSKNLIMIHRLTDEWKDTVKQDGSKGFPNRTGNKLPECHKSIPFEVDCSLRTHKSPFRIEIRESGVGKHGGALAGEMFEGEECRFKYVAAKIWGDSPKDWL